MATSDPTFPYSSNNAYSRYTNGSVSSSQQQVGQNPTSQAYSSPLVNFQNQSLPNLPPTVSSATYVSAQARLSNANGSLASYMSTQSTTRNGDTYASSSSSHAIMSDYQDVRNSQIESAGSGSHNGIFPSTTTQHATIRELSPSPHHDDAGHESAGSSKEGKHGAGSISAHRQSAKSTTKNAPQNDAESGVDSDGARNGSINGRKQKLTRIHQACINCGAKKQKCTGGNPCDSCKTNGLECAYKESKKRCVKAAML